MKKGKSLNTRFKLYQHIINKQNNSIYKLKNDYQMSIKRELRHWIIKTYTKTNNNNDNKK